MLASPLFRFLLAGAANSAFGFAVYSALALTTLPTWLVLTISTSLGLAFNFLTTGGFVFRDLGPGRAPRFVLTYLVVLALYWTLINRLSPLAGGRIGAMAIVILPMAALTYVLQSRFVFRKPSTAAGSKA
jgi:putative flippase GtrA